MKTFKPKYNLPVLQSYKLPAPLQFWDKFPKNLQQPAVSSICADTLRSMLIETKFPNTALAHLICDELKSGAKIGCVDPFRLPSRASNAPSAYEFGPHVTDAIADWTTKKFAYGPVPLHLVPCNAKFSGIMTKPKPDGSVRIILNLSAPLGSAVNEGISSNDFPTTMSSTTEWLRVLHRAGRHATFCKIDWANAYKHVNVCIEDTNLQWFSWAGMAFKELCLIFGCASSAGLFDRLAKAVLHIVLIKSNFPKNMVIQHLDDCCAAAPQGSDALAVFDATFAEVASQLGVMLAPRLDPDKSFAPNTQGLVLGIRYNTTDWTWSLSHDKMSRLLSDLHNCLKVNSVAQHVIWSLVGKLIHIRPLIPCGKFNFHHLLTANKFSQDRNTLVTITPSCKKQLFFWLTMLRLSVNHNDIPNPDAALPPWAINVFTDAAGGSPSLNGLGVGAVTPTWWAYVPWSRAINFGRATSANRSLSRAMSALELVGPLLVLSSGFTYCKNKPIKIWVDNAASVFIWKKGYSNSCPLSTTLVVAISRVAAGLGCHVDLHKITRCSNTFATLADHLSKASFSKFWSLANHSNLNLPTDPAWVPPLLLSWINNPQEDDNLGDKILTDLSKRILVLGFNC